MFKIGICNNYMMNYSIMGCLLGDVYVCGLCNLVLSDTWKFFVEFNSILLTFLGGLNSNLHSDDSS